MKNTEKGVMLEQWNESLENVENLLENGLPGQRMWLTGGEAAKPYQGDESFMDNESTGCMPAML
jgi:hypothetical protein